MVVQQGSLDAKELDGMNSTAPDPRRWWALALLCAAFSMVILDVAIVNVALPSIQKDLHFTQENLQWIVTAYALTFGGLLLLGGRLSDLLGRRLVFISGVGVFTAASLWCAVSWGEGSLITARAVQGAGAALLTAAALSIITTIFVEGAERNKALGIWGALGAAGATLGVLLGGIITDYAGWEWIFLINVPVGIGVALLHRLVLHESKADVGTRNFDLLGAFLVTSGLIVLVYALVTAPDHGWGSARTILLFAAGVGLLAAFVLVELRQKAPLMPISFLRVRQIAGANGAAFLLGAAVFAPVFILTLYMQQVLLWSPLKTGLAYLAFALTALTGSIVGQAIVTRIGVTIVAAVGSAIGIVGTFLFTQISVGGTYFGDLFVPMIVLGLGMGLAFVAVAVAAFEGVGEQETGLASGLFNTVQQIGGALGTAVLATVATSTATDEIKSGTNAAVASVHGFTDAFTVAIGFSAACLIVVLLFLRVPRPSEDLAAQPAAAE
jgi:EmrB/QacA subfamily drug resistance transporter